MLLKKDLGRDLNTIILYFHSADIIEENKLKDIDKYLSNAAK